MPSPVRVPALIDAINRTPADKRDALASECGTTLGTLRQIAYGYSYCSPERAQLIQKVFGVPATDIRPDLPELAQTLIERGQSLAASS